MGCSELYAQELTDKNFLGLDLTVIELSKEQREKLEALKSTFQAEVQDILESLKKIAPEMIALWESYPPDTEKIIAQQKEINSLQSQLSEKIILYRIKAIKILTEEQFRRATISSGKPPALFPEG